VGGGWTVARVAEVGLYVWRRTDYWRNKSVAGWWTEWLEVLLDGRVVDWAAVNVLRVLGIAEEWTCKQDGFSYMYTCILHCKDIVLKIRKKIFPEMKPSGLAPNSYFHGSVSDVIYSHDRSAYIWTFCGNI
jgi:hypothetical protein